MYITYRATPKWGRGGAVTPLKMPTPAMSDSRALSIYICLARLSKHIHVCTMSYVLAKANSPVMQ